MKKLGTEAEPFGASVGNCWDSFSSPAKGFMELFKIEEVCSSHSFQQASDVLRSAVVLQHLNWA
jgi:hypothetical protein